MRFLRIVAGYSLVDRKSIEFIREKQSILVKPGNRHTEILEFLNC